MAGIKALVALAFLASIGITFLILGCALKQYNTWWPLFNLLFYLLAPIPCWLAKRRMDSSDTTSSATWETCVFITTGLVISAYAMPIVMAHTPLTRNLIQWGACGLILAGNTVVFPTILGFFYVFTSDDSFGYSNW